MPSPLSARLRTPSRRAALAAATLAVGAMMGASLQTAVAQPAAAQPAKAATVSAAKAATTKSVIKGVTIKGSKYAVRGTNVQRGVDDLVLFLAPAKTTNTNEWGVEVTVLKGKITRVNDREKTRDQAKTRVPTGAYVLSGHGKAAEWLRARAAKGVAVTINRATVTTSTKPTTKPTTKPVTQSTSAPLGLPARVQAVYHMMWSNSGSPRLANIPKQVNVVNLAFMQGSTPTIVGWGSQSKASFIADAKALRARGVRIVASVGGAGGHLNIQNRAAFVNGVMALNKELPLDGLDWDIEGHTPMPAADVVAISKELKKQRGSKFAITLAPNGSNIDHYRGIAVQLQKAGALDMIGQQFYDAVVPKEAAKMRVAQLVSAGIPQNKVAVGMMVGPQNTYWTVQECIEAVRFIEASYPKIRGGYLWEAGRPGTAEWASKLSPYLKS